MNEETADFAVKITLKNNHLFKVRRAHGWTLQDAKRFCGTAAWDQYENMRVSPVSDGQWKPTALQIANFLCVEPETIWPDAVLAVQKNTVYRYVNAEDLHALEPYQTPDHRILSGQQNAKLTAALEVLNERQKHAIELYYGLNGNEPHTEAEIAKIFEVSSGRVNQILRHSRRILRFSPTSRQELKQIKNFPKLKWEMKDD